MDENGVSKLILQEREVFGDKFIIIIIIMFMKD